MKKPIYEEENILRGYRDIYNKKLLENIPNLNGNLYFVNQTLYTLTSFTGNGGCLLTDIQKPAEGIYRKIRQILNEDENRLGILIVPTAIETKKIIQTIPGIQALLKIKPYNSPPGIIYDTKKHQYIKDLEKNYGIK
ncbi:hypothetical protein K9L97_02085 [Candidatus Woesearchaeota archaeon]|nr:hypothetical protein [Candidatus Woesearchaeota archaeon]